MDELGDNVFVGRRAIILAGVTIGSNVIAGARAVVSRDVPDGTVVAGNPARRIGIRPISCGVDNRPDAGWVVSDLG